MFEKTLSDLVKGLRSNKRREAEFVSKCIAEIKEELSSKDKSHQVKANAVLKLAYLQMLGYRKTILTIWKMKLYSQTQYHHWNDISTDRWEKPLIIYGIMNTMKHSW